MEAYYALTKKNDINGRCGRFTFWNNLYCSNS